MDKENLNLDCWAIVELFGHQKIAGHVTTQLFGVAMMLRVDVPEFTHKHSDWDRFGDESVHHLRGEPQRVEVVVNSPAYTRYFGAGAIYAINPSTEELVRKMLHRMDAPPDICLDVQRKALPAPEEKAGVGSSELGIEDAVR